MSHITHLHHFFHSTLSAPSSSPALQLALFFKEFNKLYPFHRYILSTKMALYRSLRSVEIRKIFRIRRHFRLLCNTISVTVPVLSKQWMWTDILGSCGSSRQGGSQDSPRRLKYKRWFGSCLMKRVDAYSQLTIHAQIKKITVTYL